MDSKAEDEGTGVGEVKLQAEHKLQQEKQVRVGGDVREDDEREGVDSEVGGVRVQVELQAHERTK